MSRTLLKTLKTELSDTIPHEQLTPILAEIEKLLAEKSLALRSNISIEKRVNRLKNIVERLENYKEKIIKKVMEAGVEDPDKIEELTRKPIEVINKAMESKFLTPEIMEELKTKIDGNEVKLKKIVKEMPQDKDSDDELEEKKVDASYKERRSHINSLFRKARQQYPKEVEIATKKYIDEYEYKGKEEPFDLKKIISKTYKIYEKFDDYYGIPEDVPKPSFSELFEAIMDTRENKKIKKLTKISDYITKKRQASVFKPPVETVKVEEKIDTPKIVKLKI